MTAIEKKILAQYKERARVMKFYGWTVTDSDRFESLTVTSTEGDFYNFKYDEREELLASQPAWLEMDFKDYILASATEW